MKQLSFEWGSVEGGWPGPGIVAHSSHIQIVERGGQMVGSEYTGETGGWGGRGTTMLPAIFFVREFFSRALLSERPDQAPG